MGVRNTSVMAAEASKRLERKKMSQNEELVLPNYKSGDAPDVSEAITVARDLWPMDKRLSLSWMRRAAEAALDADQAQRSVELAKLAAELRSRANIGASAGPVAPLGRESTHPHSDEIGRTVPATPAASALRRASVQARAALGGDRIATALDGDWRGDNSSVSDVSPEGAADLAFSAPPARGQAQSDPAPQTAATALERNGVTEASRIVALDAGEPDVAAKANGGAILSQHGVQQDLHRAESTPHPPPQAEAPTSEPPLSVDRSKGTYPGRAPASVRVAVKAAFGAPMLQCEVLRSEDAAPAGWEELLLVGDAQALARLLE